MSNNIVSIISKKFEITHSQFLQCNFEILMLIKKYNKSFFIYKYIMDENKKDSVTSWRKIQQDTKKESFLRQMTKRLEKYWQENT
jgi:hypothetical protein